MLELKVSIIVPVYRTEYYLDECVESLINQTYKNLEIILVDDGSPDKCPQKCDDWAKRDPRVLVIHKNNGGLSDARNCGIEKANGDFITFTDSDDIVERTMIEDLIDIYYKYGSDLISCESRLYKNGEESIIPHYHCEDSISQINKVDFLRGILHITTDCSVCNKLFKRTLIDNHRFHMGRFNEDFLFFFDIIDNCHNITHTNKGYYKYRVTEGSLTHSFNEKNLDVITNAIEILNNVREHNPLLVNDAKYYLIMRCRDVFNEIKKNSLKKQPNFRYAYWNTKKILWKYIPFVIGSQLFSFRGKIAIFKYML